MMQKLLIQKVVFFCFYFACFFSGIEVLAKEIDDLPNKNVFNNFYLNHPPEYSDDALLHLMDEPIGNAKVVDISAAEEKSKLLVELNKNQNEAGAIYSKIPLNLTEDFTLKAYVFLGAGETHRDSGDGISFLLQNDPRMKTDKKSVIGGCGQLLGAMGRPRISSGSTWLPAIKPVENAFMVELDSFVNGCGSDAEIEDEQDYGHVAWRMGDDLNIPKSNLRDGFGPAVHNSLQLSPESFFNNTWRSFDIQWSSSTKKLTYQLHNNEIFNENISLDPVEVDLSNYEDIFKGNEVYWGFTGANGDSCANIRVSIYEIPQKKTGFTTIKYIDEETQKEIEGQNSLKLEGLIGTEYDYTADLSVAKEIENYDLQELPDNIAGVFKKEETIIKLVYRRKTKKIRINYLDEDNQPIQLDGAMPTEYEGKLGTTFRIEIPDLYPKYEWISVENANYEEGVLTGTLLENSLDINLFYKRLPEKVTIFADAYYSDTDEPIKYVAGPKKGENIVFELKNIPVLSPLKDVILANQATFEQTEHYNYTGLFDLNEIILVPPTGEVRVKLYYDGFLNLLEVTSKIDFGNQKLISSGSTTHYLRDSIKVLILDTRNQKEAEWKLQVKLKEEMKSEETEEPTSLQGGLSFNKKNKPIELTEVPLDILSKEQYVPGIETIEFQPRESITLKQLPGNVKGDYSGKLNWLLIDAL